MSVKTEAAALIRSFRTTATHYRAGTARPTVDGLIPGALVSIGSIPIKMNILTAPKLLELGCDATATVIPESDVREDDVLDYCGTRYRVGNVQPRIIAGEVINVTLRLTHSQEARHA